MKERVGTKFKSNYLLVMLLVGCAMAFSNNTGGVLDTCLDTDRLQKISIIPTIFMGILLIRWKIDCKWSHKFGLILASYFFSIFALAMANEYLDRSSGREIVSEVNDRSINKNHRYNSTEYKIFTSVDGKMVEFSVDQSNYDQALPGKTKLNFKIYPGFFGLRWRGQFNFTANQGT